MTSPFLVDNILHQQKSAIHSQYLNQQLEFLQRTNYERSRENSPEIDETKMAEQDDERNEETTDKADDEDSKSEEGFIKNEVVYYNHDYYRSEDREKEVLNIPNVNRRCHCGSFDCPPFSCKKSGIRRLEELEKRFNLHNYQDNSDEDVREKTEDMVKSCDDYNEQKKPLLKFSVSAILGEETAKNNVNDMLQPHFAIGFYVSTGLTILITYLGNQNCQALSCIYPAEAKPFGWDVNPRPLVLIQSELRRLMLL
ncbi:unnamed protein product [Leptosia nina]|uniref:Uncharacterized protein n=1 Tax=Leptosia nina TaxID=320188 RepID=A0AAV1JAX6_9NEOP